MNHLTFVVLAQEMTKQINGKNEAAAAGKAFAEGKKPSLVRHSAHEVQQHKMVLGCCCTMPSGLKGAE